MNVPSALVSFLDFLHVLMEPLTLLIANIFKVFWEYMHVHVHVLYMYVQVTAQEVHFYARITAKRMKVFQQVSTMLL